MSKQTDAVILLEKYFDVAFAAPDGIKKLRELILSLAMQGKLVPQDPSAQPASELLKEIEAEKKRLVKDGKIKQSKPLSEIKPEELPYDLPKSWEWVHLSNLAIFINGDRGKNYPSKDAYVTDGIPFINAGHLSKGLVDLNEMNYISEERFEILGSGKVKDNDILYCLRGSLGKTAVVQNIEKGAIASSLVIIRLYKLELVQFVYYYLTSSLGQLMVSKHDNGSAQPNLSANNIQKYYFPLPPLAEQRRIVAKIDELMARCDELEKLRGDRDRKQITVHTAALNRLLTAKDQSDFNTAWQFITQHFGELYSVKENVSELRKAILQLAVMGKLVPQDPSDQPASELLKEIEKEKERLVKEGKIKKSKPLPEIKLDQVPYDLPKGWEWVRFFTVNTVRSELVSAKDFPAEKQIAPDSIEKGSGKLLTHRTVEEFGAIGPNNRFYKGQILYSKIRPSLNKAVIAPYGGLCSADIYPIETFIDVNFMLKTMLSEIFLEQVRKAENRVKMPKLNLESLGIFQIALPPLAEQHRIVAKIDQLMALCDNLEKQIDAANSKQTNLLNAVMTNIGS